MSSTTDANCFDCGSREQPLIWVDRGRGVDMRRIVLCGGPSGCRPLPSHFDPKPRTLCRDPQLGTREGWVWCPECAGIQPPGHDHKLTQFGGDNPLPAGLESNVGYLRQRLAVAEADMEFAESLLCAMAFDHGRQLEDYAVCQRRPCVFCEAQ